MSGDPLPAAKPTAVVVDRDKETLTRLTEKTKSRSEQFKLLMAYFNPDDPFPPTVFLTGPPSSGKTHVITHLLRRCRIKHCYLNCSSLNIKKGGPLEPVFDSLLATVKAVLPASRKREVDFKMDSPGEFVRALKILLREHDMESEGFIIVLDALDVLRPLADSDILFPVLFRLQELLGLNVSMVGISHLPVDRLIGSRSFPLPLCVTFPQYKNEELISILSSFHPPTEDEFYSEQFYSTYIRLVLSVFYNATRDIQELYFMVQKHYRQFCEPIRAGEAKSSDLGKLWKHIEPRLKDSLKSIYLRIRAPPEERTEGSLPQSTFDVSKDILSQCLSREAKFLLVSAYLASYNPSSTDSKFFVKLSSKRKKSLASTRKDKKLQILSGPRSFPLNRLLAIYRVLSETKEGENWDGLLQIQVASLCDLGLLQPDNDNDLLTKPQYTCLANYHTAHVLSMSVGIQLENYLADLSG
ncbi:unnamed protein product [Cyprideis torosa]|uniref:Uncharacterized protein n=1 Tax=Cyprideis torosa TaxID=163714 RepID=A0A7R8WDU6_9CRUS|nr:unnamed protein product [Cyprideis torosa]CAG0888937.1 unnamed protein product [Cyprideis torosa]